MIIKKRCPNDGTDSVFISFSWFVLSHAVNGLGQTGNLAGSGILMKYSLGSSLLDDRGGIFKLSKSLFLIVRSDCGINFLDSRLDAGLDFFVALCLCSRNQNTLLCGFDVSQNQHLQYDDIGNVLNG